MDKLEAELALNELKSAVREAWEPLQEADSDGSRKAMLAAFVAYKLKCGCHTQMFAPGEAPEQAYEGIPAIVAQATQPGHPFEGLESVAVVSHMSTLYGPGDPHRYAEPREDPRYRECVSIIFIHETGWTGALAPVIREQGKAPVLGEWSYDSPFCLQACEKDGHNDLIRMRVYLEVQGKDPTPREVLAVAAKYGLT